MSAVNTEAKTNIENELYTQYNWFCNSFLSSIQTSTDEFFTELFSFKLVSVSKNINILFQGDDYFVTKIRIDKEHDVFFRCSSDAIKIILDATLGENKKFEISNITELEAKIISSFNDYIYNHMSKFLLATRPKLNGKHTPPPPKRKNFDTIHLTFFIKDNSSKQSAKLIVSLPQVLLAPEKITPKEEKFNISNFKSSKLKVNIKVGTTKFPLKDIKNLEKEDIVVFDDSDIHLMTLAYGDYKKAFRVNPNPGLITTAKSDGGQIMDNNSLSQSLWDNIQIEMGAEFEKVKISLGELKNIEEGLVVDLTSVYDNKIFLKVENKTIAKGELVIINDRYGVRIDEVFAAPKEDVQEIHQHQDEAEQESSQEVLEESEEGGEEEFDYSDFELDDEDI